MLTSMMRVFRPVAVMALLASLALAACSTIPRFEAANDIHAFLVSIRDTDTAAFDAHLDRPALKSQLKARLLSGAVENSGAASPAALGALLVGPLVDIGVDTLVRPDVFRAIAVEVGYSAEKPVPNVVTISQFVRPLDDGRACIFTRRNGPCVLMFKDEAGVWKLIGFEGRMQMGKGGRLKLAP